MPRFLSFHATILIICVGGVLANGCQKPESTSYKEVNLSGRVLLDGRPISGAKILFAPLRLRDSVGNYLPSSFAVTDSEGRYELFFENREADAPLKQGVVPGPHWVWISTEQLEQQPRPETDVAQSGDASEADKESESSDDSREKRQVPLPRSEEIPDQYNGATRLLYEVPMQGSSQADFLLRSGAG